MDPTRSGLTTSNSMEVWSGQRLRWQSNYRLTGRTCERWRGNALQVRRGIELVRPRQMQASKHQQTSAQRPLLEQTIKVLARQAA